MQGRDLNTHASDQRRGPTTQHLQGGVTTPTMKGQTNPGGKRFRDNR